jgi:hypothetical protein
VPKPVEPTSAPIKPHPVKNHDRLMLEFEYHCLIAKCGKLTEGQRNRLSIVRDELGLCKFKQPQLNVLPIAA